MRNKLLILLSRYRLRLALLLLTVPPFLSMPALGDQEGDFQFQIVGDGAAITGYVGSGDAVVIPDTLSGRPVTGIGHDAFVGMTNLTGVTIPNSVTSIGYSAFRRCTSVTSVIIPDGVTSMGSSVFESCTSLTNVTFGMGLTVIVQSTFENCTGLMNVTIPNSVTSIDLIAFSGCTGLTNVTISDSVTNIGFGAFLNCSGLANLTIPIGVIDIGTQAFYGCSGLKTVTIGNNVASISSSAFSGCTGLTNVTIPNSVTSLGTGAFVGCTNLVSVTVGDSVPAIPSATFTGCRRLQSVSLGTSVRSIEGSRNVGFIIFPGAFSGCADLTGISIPDAVYLVGSDAFVDCSSLVAFAVSPLSPHFSSLEGVLFDKTQSILYQYPPGKPGAYVISESVTAIRDFAFRARAGLTSVTIGENVTSIWYGAFSYCNNLTNVAFGAGLTSIGPSAFSSCSSLTSVVIPNSVTAIGNAAFSRCERLKNITLGTNLALIGIQAFYGCSSLASVTIPSSVINIGFDAFRYCTVLTSVCFEGDAPMAQSGMFFESPFVTVFYRAEAAGWNFTFADRPTAVWVPRPAYADWVVSTGLSAQFPQASGEGNDPDGDGLTNRDEWFAGTDPTQRGSLLKLELAPRPTDLSDEDLIPVPDGQHALYFRSTPSRYYGVQQASTLGDGWELKAVRVADSTQTRFLLPQPEAQAFYRVAALP